MVFVTVDPARDTPELMKTYLSSFDPRIVGLTGTEDEIAAAAKAYKVYYRKVPTDSDYTMDHTATIFLMDSQGRFLRHVELPGSAGRPPREAQRQLVEERVRRCVRCPGAMSDAPSGRTRREPRPLRPGLFVLPEAAAGEERSAS